MPVTKSDFACRCCGKNLIKEEIVILCNDIETKLGLSLKVNSGYRCERHNAAVGGQPNSEHMQGNAADITCPDIQKLAKLCQRLWNTSEIGGLGLYSRFCHVDTGRHRTWRG